MRRFEWDNKTEVIFGCGTAEEAGRQVRRFGGTRAMVVYGGGSVIRSGLLDRVCASLEAEGIAVIRFGGVQPNPRLQKAREGVQLGLAEQVDFLLPVGGGSVIDTAKAIAIGIADPSVDIWEYWKKTVTVTKTTKLGALLTLPAAGSETSNSAVLTNEETGEKWGLSTVYNRPLFAIMDPDVAATLPPYQVGCGVADIMMHTLDRYFNACFDNELTDELAEALLRVVIRHGTAAVKDPADSHAMSEVMWAGSLSHNGLTGLGGTVDFAVHQFGHELSARYDVAHGASLAAVWGTWARYVLAGNEHRFARYARKVWQLDIEDDAAAAMEGIRATEDYFRAIGMPTSIGDLGVTVTEADLDHMAEGCSRGRSRTIGKMRVLAHDDMREVYRKAL